LKLVAWAKKNALRLSRRASLPKQIIVARFTQTIRARKAEWFRTDSGTSYRLSKSDKPPCPAERHFYSSMSIRAALVKVNNRVKFPTIFLSISLSRSAMLRCAMGTEKS